TLTPGTAPSPASGSITMNADGTITVAPGTTAGTYTYDYTICENLNPANCDTATATILVLPDYDKDGVIDIIDIDDDNDGIPDTLETNGTDPTADLDNDGVPAYLDEDDTNPVIGDDIPGIEKEFDFDGDGIPNHLDLDADNDAIPDVLEAGNTDSNNDGIVDSVSFGANGLADEVETSPESGVLINNPLNTDSSSDSSQSYTLYDFLDVDSDNDGITDNAEAFSNNATYNDADNDGQVDGLVDLDNNGWHDTIDNEATFPVLRNSDADTIPNHLDLDSDGDGLPDTFEGNFQVADNDNDGIVGTGIPVDSDGDGLADSNDPDNAGNILGGFGFNKDRDGDGVNNYLDIDIDNDGIIDNIEGQGTFSYVSPTGLDTDGDGIDNAYDVDNGGVGIGYTNTDGGSAPDYADTNSDGVDGVGDAFDLLENAVDNSIDGPLDTDNDGIVDPALFVDVDGDGLHDDFEYSNPAIDGANNTTNPDNATNNNQLPTDQPDVDPAGGDRDWRELSSQDKDQDGIPDVSDLDDDNDGILDTEEDANLDGDNDPRTNPTDFDGDGVPDYFDLDSDNDGIPDYTEAGGTNDPDGNGQEGTGVLDSTEVDANGIPLGVAPGGLSPIDTDGDGNFDFLDLDSDNDGISDVLEAGGVDSNGNGRYGSGTTNDSDADGLVDALDPYDDRDGNLDSNLGGTPLIIEDTDGDGQLNYLDLDSDNDTIPDNVEGQSTVGYIAPSGVDTDNDGLDDNYDSSNGGTYINVVNTDGTDTPDYLDLDSDNDLLFDIDEAGNSVADTDSDGQTNGVTGANGLDDAYDDGTAGDTFADPNGILDNTQTDNFPDADADVFAGGDVDYRDNTFEDNDGDGIADAIDLDDDNDGILDTEESNGTDPLADADGDNVPDYQDPDFCTLNSFGICENLDIDNDGIPNHFDTDSDNDSCPDANEAYSDSTADSNNDGTYGGVVGASEVNSDGTVIAATYPGTNANVITAVQVTVDVVPSNQSEIEGNPATFSVTASSESTTTFALGVPDYGIPPATDDSVSLIYQWQENGLNLSDTGVYSGTTTAILNISDVTGLDGNIYNVIITHANNVCIEEQNSATLNVIPRIIANNDDFSSVAVNGTDGGTSTTVLANDTINGAAVIPANITLTPGTAPSPASGSITMNADGTITVAPGTTAGTYTYDYTICENLNPANCDTATATVVVAPAPIDAVADDYSASPVNGFAGGSTTTVLGNDTLNGVAVVPVDVTLTPGTAPSPASGSITMNADGTITVAPGTTAGTYTYDYTICENLNPANCDTATATLVVEACPSPIDSDGDGLTDCEETTGIDDPSTPADPTT
ncbi:hypothetical protein SAMN05216261_1281, partial [Algibacter luteus]